MLQSTDTRAPPSEEHKHILYNTETRQSLRLRKTSYLDSSALHALCSVALLALDLF